MSSVQSRNLSLVNRAGENNSLRNQQILRGFRAAIDRFLIVELPEQRGLIRQIIFRCLENCLDRLTGELDLMPFLQTLSVDLDEAFRSNEAIRLNGIHRCWSYESEAAQTLTFVLLNLDRQFERAEPLRPIPRRPSPVSPESQAVREIRAIPPYERNSPPPRPNSSRCEEFIPEEDSTSRVRLFHHAWHVPVDHLAAEGLEGPHRFPHRYLSAISGRWEESASFDSRRRGISREGFPSCLPIIPNHSNGPESQVRLVERRGPERADSPPTRDNDPYSPNHLPARASAERPAGGPVHSSVQPLRRRRQDRSATPPRRDAYSPPTHDY